MAHYAVEYGITRHPLAFLFCSFSLFFSDIKCGSTFKSFLKYCAEEDIELYNYYVKVKSIHRFKGGKNNKLEYLTTDQVKLLLNEPDTKLRIGKRNQFLMIMLYETGIRLDELLNLKLNAIVSES